MAQVAIITSDRALANSVNYHWRNRGLILALPGTLMKKGQKIPRVRWLATAYVRRSCELDLGNLPEGAQALKLIQRLGRIDVLVNNAGAISQSTIS